MRRTDPVIMQAAATLSNRMVAIGSDPPDLGKFWQVVERLESDEAARRQEAYLGLATTEKLLEELATRMEITQNSTEGRALGEKCREALRGLDRGVLNYSTAGRG